MCPNRCSPGRARGSTRGTQPLAQLTLVVERPVEVVAAGVEAGGELDQVPCPRVASPGEAGQGHELLGAGGQEPPVHAAVVCKEKTGWEGILGGAGALLAPGCLRISGRGCLLVPWVRLGSLQLPPKNARAGCEVVVTGRGTLVPCSSDKEDFWAEKNPMGTLPKHLPPPCQPTSRFHFHPLPHQL